MEYPNSEIHDMLVKLGLGGKLKTMAKGLLIGNGINARLGIKDLYAKCIYERFIENISVYSVIIQKLFGVQIKDDFIKSLQEKSDDLGIETLAGMLYRYIESNKKQKGTDNDEYRLQDVIACIGITSIFYTKEGKIGSDYDKDMLPSMSQYDYIFTLNYAEFWDTDNKCIYLHGKVDLSELPNERNAILISTDRMNLKCYAEAIDYIKKTNNVIKIKPNNIVFSPEGVNKNKLICVAGIFPSNNLYPANDLFFYRPKELYAELGQVDELDVFGMSPYGDASIIEKINSINKVRIFVYNKDKNKETEDWKSKLTCSYEILDSTEMR